jgi:hypothetical protein
MGGAPDTPPYPIGRGIFVNLRQDRFVVRLKTRRDQPETWLRYKLSTGEKLGFVEPYELSGDNEFLRFIVSAAPIRGTPLILVHWWRYDGENAGGRYVLVDYEARPVWWIELDHDYRVPGDRYTEDRIMNFIQQKGGIYSTSDCGTFELLFVSDRAIALFHAACTGKGKWTVREIGRKPLLGLAPWEVHGGAGESTMAPQSNSITISPVCLVSQPSVP